MLWVCYISGGELCEAMWFPFHFGFRETQISITCSVEKPHSLLEITSTFIEDTFGYEWQKSNLNYFK